MNQFYLPDERSRVRCLLDMIITTDAQLLDAIVNVGLKEKGMMDNFEKADAVLLMHDSIEKLKSVSRPSNRDNLSRVLEATVSASSSASNKLSKGKTGVEFRFYKCGEFMNLSQEQRDELT